MKTIYIPKGETVRYDTLATEHLIVKGFLQVTGDLKAKTISGSGVISAGSVSADRISIGELEAAAVISKRLIAKKVMAPEVFASESAAVSCFFSASYVETGKLTVSISEINDVKADEVVHPTSKKRSLFGTLLASVLRSFWTALTTPKTRGEVLDAEYVSAAAAEKDTKHDQEENVEIPVQKEEVEVTSGEIVQRSEQEEESDLELKRIVAIFNLLRDEGYTLKIVPGTPEENAPVFDFPTERIIRPAA